jgi:hypothetical protein
MPRIFATGATAGAPRTLSGTSRVFAEGCENRSAVLSEFIHRFQSFRFMI